MVYTGVAGFKHGKRNAVNHHLSHAALRWYRIHECSVLDGELWYGS